MEKEKKKQIIKISVFITSIFVIFLSVTYAFINMTLTGTRRQVLTAGNLELELLEDENNLTITNAMPMYDEVGMTQENFTFRLVNKTATDTNYIVKLVDITTGEKLSTNIVKYGLTKDGVSTINLLSNLSDNVLDKGIITGNQTIKYSLRLWIDSGVEDNTVILGKSLSYRINVEVNQPFNIIQKISYNSTEAFWKYKDNISIVAFENQINIPDNAIENWDVSTLKDGSVMAYIEKLKNDTYKVHIQGKNTIFSNNDCSYLFYKFSKLSLIEGLEYFDTSNATNMSYIFYGCNSLVSLDLSSFDTSNVKNMADMFSGCSSLTSLDVSDFDTTNVTNMYAMFNECSSLTSLDVSNFDTSKVTDMIWMFSGCSTLFDLDLSNFRTGNVVSMRGMFYECKNLSSVNLSYFDTSKVTDMARMFCYCSNLSVLDLSSFRTKSLTDMSHMFYDCSKLNNLDISNFEIGEVTFTGMFGLVPKNCLVLVKDATVKNWMKNSFGDNLTNVVVKSI